jgi:hypothetical protein
MLIEPIIEIVQIAGFTTLLLCGYRRQTALTNGVLLWFVVSLSVDVFLFQCVRPLWVQEAVNVVNINLGWIILYEKYKPIFRRVVVALVALFRQCRDS